MSRPASVPRGIAVSILTTVLLLSGCNRKEAERPAEATPVAEPIPPASAGHMQTPSAIQSAAAEFETLAAKTPGATWAEIDSLHVHAKATAARARTDLTRAAADDLDRSMQLLDRARREENRAAFELGALDAKRNLILGRTADVAHPTAPAELLVTEGQRYMALTRASTPDWAALSTAAAAADDAWRRTAPLVRPQAIPNTMQAGLSAMAEAAKAKDLTAARRAGDLQIAASRTVLKTLEAAPPVAPAAQSRMP